MEYSPPPLFKQGASARVKVTFFALLSLALLTADSHLNALMRIRQAVGVALYPLQMLALMPRDATYAVAGYFDSLSSLQKENDRLRREKIANGQTLQQSIQLMAENVQLRRLLAASEKVPVKSVMGEILYDARDAFTRKIILNRGARHGIASGQPVIDDVGIVGQVTRVFPLTSEITLLTDKDQAIPVQVVRSGLRSIAYGRGQSGVLDLRFMPANADIHKGDVLVTSGIDGVYPPGLTVATVTEVENKSTDAFARIVCQPTAGIDRNRQLLVLLVDTSIPPRPEGESVDRKDRRRSGAVAKDGAAESAAPAPAAQNANGQTTSAAPAAATPAAPASSSASPKAGASPVIAPASAPAKTSPAAASAPSAQTPASVLPAKPVPAPPQAAPVAAPGASPKENAAREAPAKESTKPAAAVKEPAAKPVTPPQPAAAQPHAGAATSSAPAGKTPETARPALPANGATATGTTANGAAQ